MSRRAQRWNARHRECAAAEMPSGRVRHHLHARLLPQAGGMGAAMRNVRRPRERRAEEVSCPPPARQGQVYVVAGRCGGSAACDCPQAGNVENTLALSLSNAPCP